MEPLRQGAPEARTCRDWRRHQLNHDNAGCSDEDESEDCSKLTGLHQVTALLHQKGLHHYTPKTLMSPHSLKENLALIRKMGFSHDDEEHALGLRCVAAPIYDEHGEPFAAISISGPLARMTDDRITELGALVIRAAKQVTLSYAGR